MKRYPKNAIKIKHYNQTYRYGKKNWIGGVLKWALILLLLVGLGIGIGYCAMNLDKILPSKPGSGTITEPTDVDTPDFPDIPNEPDQPDDNPEPELPPQKTYNDVVYMCGLSTLFSDDGLENVVQQAKLNGADNVAIELKATGGQILYQSYSGEANAAGAVSPNAIDLAHVVTYFHERDIHVIGIVSAYRDHLYASYNRTAASHYDSSDMLWLDNTAQAGGKPWLAPGAPGTDAYLGTILEEIVDYGVDGIILSDAVVPINPYWAHASTGFDPSISRTQGMQNAIDALAERVHAKGKSFSLLYPYNYILDSSVCDIAYNQLKADTFYVDVQMPVGTPAAGVVVSGTMSNQDMYNIIEAGYRDVISNMAGAVHIGVTVTGEKKLILP